MNIFKPMLAASLDDISKVQYPVLVSPKLDGIRCIIKDGVALSRSLKLIPNRHIQKILGKFELNGLDGEIMIEGEDFNGVQSAVMSEDGEPNFTYHVFDSFNLEDAFFQRFDLVKRRIAAWALSPFMPILRLVPHLLAANQEELLAYESQFVKMGYEGLMVRSLNGPYKHGRSTLKEGSLLKLKRFKDAEATITGFVERMHNTNEATKNELGHTERSSFKSGMVPTNSLGALIVQFNDKELEIGTGFNEEQRVNLWKTREDLLGKLVKFKYQDLSKYGVPRFPVYLGMRDERDL